MTPELRFIADTSPNAADDRVLGLQGQYGETFDLEADSLSQGLKHLPV